MPVPTYHTLTDSWFRYMAPFEQQETTRQVAFKQKHWPHLPPGESAANPGHFYPHILPAGDPDPLEHLPKVFYPGEAQAILAYLQANTIHLHRDALNLRSSQVACLNFLFPLAQDPTLAVQALQPLFPDLAEVERIEFEYTGPGPLPGEAVPEITRWLGEPPGEPSRGSHRGGRGQYRTSIDAAVFGRDPDGLPYAILLEWKYTEGSFGTCSAFSAASPQERQANCESLDVRRNPAARCLLATGEPRRQRRYWEHMPAAGLDLEKLAVVGGCPFQGPFYQLMRQFLLAAYLRQHGWPRCEVVVLGFQGNPGPLQVPPALHGLLPNRGDLIDAWNTALGLLIPPLRYLFVETLLVNVERSRGMDSTWREYIKERYGV